MFTQALNICIKTTALVILLNLGSSSLTNDKLAAQSEAFTSQKVKAEFIPPKGSGVPKDPTTAGGTRPVECYEVNSCLIPLLPVSAISKLDYYPLTVSERPTFYISLPRTSGTAIFTLYQHLPSQIKKIHRFSFPVKTSGGIVGITLPKSSPTLQNDSTYEWRLSLKNETANGFVRRVQLKPNLSQKLREAKPLDQLAIYAAEGIWYDSIETLAALANSQPSDRKVFTEWAVFLKSANIAPEMIKQSFTTCCQAEN
ncbi:membrane proteins related to metalloendopeptidases [Pseudanabaena sp. lw0831]|uniref:DUF928 domain-containing protein n=1 Tax=Pseudanabaena sp. lw0831 TaxID=1357935 RepID=UPI0019167356|nr:DUF928 domain-containing protein [Pseudanabaena sp. lw0831]GBO54377.1 membrane proteins related to metalloendopeptidases [Pseudanabaena sp. lw0831]